MRKIFLAGTAILALLGAGAASAADLPRRTEPIAPIAPVLPIFTWTGFYVGVNAGYGYGGSRVDGFVGGGQIGFNYQINQFVAGVEADIQYAGLDIEPAVVPGFFPITRGGLEWFGTVRARLGFAFDRALIYATGGFAYGGFDDARFPFVARGVFANDGDVEGGYTLGGGFEYAFTPNLSAKLEGLYVNLDRGTGTGVVGFTAAGRPVAGRFNSEFEFGVFRAGLNYRF